MLAVFGVMGVTGGTRLACGATKSRFEKQLDVLSGTLLVAGTSMIGFMAPFFH